MADFNVPGSVVCEGCLGTEVDTAEVKVVGNDDVCVDDGVGTDVDIGASAVFVRAVASASPAAGAESAVFVVVIQAGRLSIPRTDIREAIGTDEEMVAAGSFSELVVVVIATGSGRGATGAYTGTGASTVGTIEGTGSVFGPHRDLLRWGCLDSSAGDEVGTVIGALEVGADESPGTVTSAVGAGVEEGVLTDGVEDWGNGSGVVELVGSVASTEGVPAISGGTK